MTRLFAIALLALAAAATGSAAQAEEDALLTGTLKTMSPKGAYRRT